MGKCGDDTTVKTTSFGIGLNGPRCSTEHCCRRLGAPAGRLEWFCPTGAEGEREPEGLSFLRDREDVQALWRQFWPQRRTAQTWDGVAKLHTDSATEWVLVERYSHV
jgi:hypothetical protein